MVAASGHLVPVTNTKSPTLASTTLERTVYLGHRRGEGNVCMIINLEYSDFQLPSGTRRGLLPRKSEIPGSILAVDGQKLHLCKCPGVKTSLQLHRHLTSLSDLTVFSQLPPNFLFANGKPTIRSVDRQTYLQKQAGM